MSRMDVTPATRSLEEEQGNAEAIALLEEWYMTPDDRPADYWDDLLKEIETHPLQFGNEDLELVE